MHMTNAIPDWAEQLAVFDTETTGLSPATARVVTATVAVINAEGDPVERYDWILDPGVEIPQRATSVHGITTEMARATGTQAVSGIGEILSALRNMWHRGLPLVVYNAPYDLTLLKHEAQRYSLAFPEHPKPVFDPLIIDKQVDRFRRGKRTLEVVAQHYGVPLEDAHDSGADAIAAGRVLQAIARTKGAELPDEPALLHDAQVDWAAEQAANFQAYMRRVKDPNFVAHGDWPYK